MSASQTIETGTVVRYEDMANARVGVVVEVQVTRWGTQYGVRFGGTTEVAYSDLRQSGWTIAA